MIRQKETWIIQKLMRWFLTDIFGHAELRWRLTNSWFNSEICLGRLSRWNNLRESGRDLSQECFSGLNNFFSRGLQQWPLGPEPIIPSLNVPPRLCHWMRDLRGVRNKGSKGQLGIKSFWLCRKKKDTSGKKRRWWQVVTRQISKPCDRWQYPSYSQRMLRQILLTEDKCVGLMPEEITLISWEISPRWDYKPRMANISSLASCKDKNTIFLKCSPFLRHYGVSIIVGSDMESWVLKRWFCLKDFV